MSTIHWVCWLNVSPVIGAVDVVLRVRDDDDREVLGRGRTGRPAVERRRQLAAVRIADADLERRVGRDAGRAVRRRDVASGCSARRSRSRRTACPVTQSGPFDERAGDGRAGRARDRGARCPRSCPSGRPGPAPRRAARSSRPGSGPRSARRLQTRASSRTPSKAPTAVPAGVHGGSQARVLDAVGPHGLADGERCAIEDAVEVQPPRGAVVGRGGVVPDPVLRWV